MPLLRIQRYATGITPFIDYFVTGPSYDANSTAIVLELDPTLFPSRGEYAVFRTTGSITNTTTPVGTSSWTSAHPSSYTVSAPFIGTRIIGGTSYNCILVTVA